MTMDPVSVVESYFAKVRAGDMSVVDLFHENAVLKGLGSVRSGRDEIDAVYRKGVLNGRVRLT